MVDLLHNVRMRIYIEREREYLLAAVVAALTKRDSWQNPPSIGVQIMHGVSDDRRIFTCRKFVRFSGSCNF